MMVRDFHASSAGRPAAGAESRLGRLPDVLVACVGGGSNAIGLFYPFIGDRRVRIVGASRAARGSGRPARASMTAGRVGVLTAA